MRPFTSSHFAFASLSGLHACRQTKYGSRGVSFLQGAGAACGLPLLRLRRGYIFVSCGEVARGGVSSDGAEAPIVMVGPRSTSWRSYAWSLSYS